MDKMYVATDGDGVCQKIWPQLLDITNWRAEIVVVAIFHKFGHITK